MRRHSKRWVLMMIKNPRKRACLRGSPKERSITMRTHVQTQAPVIAVFIYPEGNVDRVGKVPSLEVCRNRNQSRERQRQKPKQMQCGKPSLLNDDLMKNKAWIHGYNIAVVHISLQVHHFWVYGIERSKTSSRSLESY